MNPYIDDDLQTLAEHALPAFRPSFTPLERSREVFPWDPV